MKTLQLLFLSHFIVHVFLYYLFVIIALCLSLRKYVMFVIGFEETFVPPTPKANLKHWLHENVDREVCM